MIDPAETVSPANTFTPNRWAWESRPFFEDPSPFLCAIARVLLLGAGASRARRGVRVARLRLCGGLRPRGGLRLGGCPRLGSRLRFGGRLLGRLRHGDPGRG